MTARATIEATRTFTSDYDGLPAGREVPRTPPPTLAALSADELGQRWLAATGVPDAFAASSAEEIDDEEAIGRAWVDATLAGWA